MECFKAQNALIQYYAVRARVRGNHAVRVSGNKAHQYAECFAPFSRGPERASTRLIAVFMDIYRAYAENGPRSV